jgi:zinc-ribbon domain
VATVVCPVCGHENLEEAHRCTNCGEPLTMFGQVMSRHDGGGASMRLNQSRVQASSLQEQGLKGSEARMGSLEAVDRRRLDAQREASDSQVKKDRLILTISAGAFVLLVIVLLAFGAFTLLR